LTLTGGNPGNFDGGAIYNTSNLTLIDVNCNNNIAGGNGGAIYNGFGATLTASAIWAGQSHVNLLVFRLFCVPDTRKVGNEHGCPTKKG
jgi:hypothetical protein